MWGLLFYLVELIGLSPLPFAASLIGTTTPALKLLISILMGYPIGIVYHKYIKHQVQYRSYYFAIMGIDMAFYNFGISMYHNLIAAIVTYLINKYKNPGVLSTAISFVFNITYLLAGYINTESEDYDITWTMPHCVLTLKLIALSFDLWDGKKMLKGEQLSVNNSFTALRELPSFIDLLGFVYFPACFLVGPIFSFRRYSDFITDKFPLDLGAPKYKRDAIKRLLQGLMYLMAFQIGVSVFSMDYILSDEFWDNSIFYRHFYCGLWAHFALYKYISCWLLTEACCIRIGFSYNGIEHGVTKWDGCSNIKLIRFETATKFQHYIESFNCNTNHFAAEYIYKRLKFLGMRNVSQFLTLLFLALWHGTKSGYYMTFFNEYIIIYMEKELESIINKTEIYQKLWSHNAAKYGLYVLLKTYTIVFMGWSLVPFDLKSFSKWWSVYYSLYFSGFLLFLPWGLVYKRALFAAIKSYNKRRD